MKAGASSAGWAGRPIGGAAEAYDGSGAISCSRWHHLRAGEVPVIMLVRDGASIPHARLAQSTGSIDWGGIELLVFGAGETARGYFCHPERGELHVLRLRREGGGFALMEDPLNGRVDWSIRTLP